MAISSYAKHYIGKFNTCTINPVLKLDYTCPIMPILKLVCSIPVGVDSRHVAFLSDGYASESSNQELLFKNVHKLLGLPNLKWVSGSVLGSKSGKPGSDHITC